MRGVQKASRLFSRMSAAAKRALRSKMLAGSSPRPDHSAQHCGLQCLRLHCQRRRNRGCAPVAVKISGKGRSSSCFWNAADGDFRARRSGRWSPAQSRRSRARAIIFATAPANHLVSVSDVSRCRPVRSAGVRDLAPFRDESFDYAQACNVLDYVPELEQAFRAIHRVVRPSGVFVFLIPEHNLLPANEPISVSVLLRLPANIGQIGQRCPGSTRPADTQRPFAADWISNPRKFSSF